MQSLTPYQIGKPIEELERELGISDIVKLASNENPLGTPETAIKAIKRILFSVSQYPDGGAFMLKQRLAQKLACKSCQTTIGNGSSELLELIARVFLSPEYNAIVSRYAFIVSKIAVKALGVELRVAEAKGFGHDLDAMASLVDKNTKLVFITNPNNPTGNCLAFAEIEAFLQKIPAQVMVILDEAYHEYVDMQGYASGLSLLERYPNLIIVRTFSKAYGLAGLRIGYSISHEDTADLLNRLRAPFNINLLALEAASAVLDDDNYLGNPPIFNRPQK